MKTIKMHTGNILSKVEKEARGDFSKLKEVSHRIKRI
jgi:hypothetical protein